MAGKSRNHHPDRVRWNRRYSRQGPEAFGRGPSDWLLAHESLLRTQPRGTALDVACGNGRNAFYLARLGFSVDAVDISDEAVAWLGQQVSQEDWSIHPRRMDLGSEPLPIHRYQVVVNINYLERGLFSSLREALLPDGLLFFETFTKDQIDLPGGRIPPRFTLDPNELLEAFSGMEILGYREAILEAGSRGRKKAVASLVARKRQGERLPSAASDPCQETGSGRKNQV